MSHLWKNPSALREGHDHLHARYAPMERLSLMTLVMPTAQTRKALISSLRPSRSLPVAALALMRRHFEQDHAASVLASSSRKPKKLSSCCHLPLSPPLSSLRPRRRFRHARLSAVRFGFRSGAVIPASPYLPICPTLPLPAFPSLISYPFVIHICMSTERPKLGRLEDLSRLASCSIHPSCISLPSARPSTMSHPSPSVHTPRSDSGCVISIAAASCPFTTALRVTFVFVISSIVIPHLVSVSVPARFCFVFTGWRRDGAARILDSCCVYSSWTYTLYILHRYIDSDCPTHLAPPTPTPHPIPPHRTRFVRGRPRQNQNTSFVHHTDSPKSPLRLINSIRRTAW